MNYGFKGTKGKWLVQDIESNSNNKVRIKQESYVATLHFCLGDSRYYIKALSPEENTTEKEALYNALLISKAPEMLEMLKDILEANENGEIYHSYKIDQLLKEATEL